MRSGVVRFVAPHLILFCLALFTPSFVRAQGTVIEPCPGTAAPAKPTVSSTNSAPVKADVKVTETLIDSNLTDDAGVESVIAPYAEKVRNLTLVLGRLDSDLRKTTPGAGSIGGFVADGIRFEAERRLGRPVALAIMNSGGMRKNEIKAGEIRASDIFELLPFENTLIVAELTGAQLAKLIPLGVRDAQSGTNIQFKWNDQNRAEFISGKLVDKEGRETDVEPDKVYTIVTIDYLYNLNSGAYAILRESKKITRFKVTVRDAMMDYVKAQTAAGRTFPTKGKDRLIQVGPDPTGPVVPND
jgi:2',3'-cyclic-nucleotide 2'-phosphodiesterase (5'-nucleotidase family)